MMKSTAEPAAPGLRHWWEPIWEPIARTAGLLSEAALAPFYTVYQRYLEAQVPTWSIPGHIGIIMDGNRRFARSRHFHSPIDGHARGADKLEEVLNWCEETGVDVVTVWIFSLDNFNRDPGEVDGLMDLFERKFLELVTHPRVHAQQIRVRSIGQTASLPPRVQQAIHDAEEATSGYTRRVLNIGVAYGGREEIVDAMRRYLQDQAARGRDLATVAEQLSPDCVTPYLYTSHVPDPDLIIRTSGEIRLSGFLLWQSVYSEFYFCDTNWPAFRKIDFLRALRDYSQRKRRFGR